MTSYKEMFEATSSGNIGTTVHLIVPSCCEWSSPVVITNKADGTFRLAIDCRALNLVIIKYIEE